jgi:hypothetical protein
MKVRLLSLAGVICLVLAVILLVNDASGNAGKVVLLLLAFTAISTILAIRAAFHKVRNIARDARAFISGDIQHARLIEVSEPKGIIFTRVNFVLELEGEDGKKHQFDRDVPTPFFTAWAYRLGKRFNLPLLRRFNPTTMLAMEFKREGMSVSVSRPAGGAPEISAG